MQNNIAVCNGGYVKLDFDPRKNVTILDKVVIPFKKTISKINDFIVIHHIIKNWSDVLMFRLGLKKANFTMVLRNGTKFKISKPGDYFEFWGTEEWLTTLLKQILGRRVRINKREKVIKFYFKHELISLFYDSVLQFGNTVGAIKEQFIEEQYRWLDVKEKDVIDIGANVGDTAIYFSLKGAKHVYAFEPYPYSYRIALQDIKLNNLANKITFLNEGCSGKETIIKVDTNYKNIGGTDLKIFNKGKRIKITTLESIVKKFNIKYPAILKIDCEGCEYGVLLGAQNSDLKRFKQILVEYHYGYLNLKRKLEDAGFKVNSTLPKYSNNLEAQNKDMLVGLIYAER